MEPMGRFSLLFVLKLFASSLLPSGPGGHQPGEGQRLLHRLKFIVVAASSAQVKKEALSSMTRLQPRRQPILF